MGVLVQKVMFHLPRVVVPQPIRKLDLVQRFLVQLILGVLRPRLRQLVLVEDPKPHGFITPHAVIHPAIGRSSPLDVDIYPSHPPGDERVMMVISSDHVSQMG